MNSVRVQLLLFRSLSGSDRENARVQLEQRRIRLVELLPDSAQ
ncbi:MAG: hypothetical protein ACI9R3_003066 [Verrucomicrobiales bacterium]|jgi:hypothetical protein